MRCIFTMKSTNVRRGRESSWGLSVPIVCLEKVSDKVTLEWGPEGNPGVIQAGTWGRVFHAQGMAGAKTPQQTCRGGPPGWSRASGNLGPCGAAQLQGRVREGLVGRTACVEASGVRQALSVFQSPSPYLILRTKLSG